MAWEIVPFPPNPDPAWHILAIHAALLPTGDAGEIMYFGGDEHSQDQHDAGDIDHTRLFNLATNEISALPSPTTDVFCSSHAFLADGRLLVGGGTEQWGTACDPDLPPPDPNHPHCLNFGGHRECWFYRPRARTWQQVRSMNFQPGRTTGGGRWYPTLITLATGQVIAASGHPSRTDTRHENDLPERYSSLTNSWTLLDNQEVDTSFYPRLFLLPDGNVFFGTPIGTKNRIYDPGAGAFVGSEIDRPTEDIYWGWNATAVMLPLLPADGYSPRILLCGGVDPFRINLADASPAWVQAGTRMGAPAGEKRQYGTAVLLPTGQVFMSGGVSTVGNAPGTTEVGVMQGEIYSPGIDWATGAYVADTDSWVTDAPANAAQVVRNYHSVALLLPNGRVWTAGSSKRAAAGDPDNVAIAEKRIEIYKPSYDDNLDRPTITASPQSVSYGESFEIESPQAADIERVALIRCGSTTHAFNADQRYVGLTFTWSGTTLTATAPSSSAVAPPGYYMLWIVDENDLPCQMAKFVRLSDQQCSLITDRSTFSVHEVQALLDAGASARFTNAFYVVMQDFLPHEVGSPPIPPTITFRRPDGSAVPGMTAEFYQTLYEDPALPADVTQRITFAFTIRFDSTAAFGAIPAAMESQTITLRAVHGSHVCESPLVITKNPNPYMRDGDVHWLSIDLRVFQIRPGMTRAGVTHGSGAGAPYTFIQALLAAYDGASPDDTHPFLDISTDQQTSKLEFSSHVNGQPVYNYAVAKVRYRAPAGGVSAENVRVFFRAFTTAATTLEFNTSTTYRRFGNGADAAPLLGLAGGEIASLPFFAQARAANMEEQADTANLKTLNPAGAGEFHAYFGCWLDFNQPTPRFPLNPVGNGPFGGSLNSIQELIRGNHQCLVAEIHYPPDPIPAGAGPGSSDNLAQRNLIIIES